MLIGKVKAANALLGETAKERTDWVQSRVLEMLCEQTQALIAALHTLATAAEGAAQKTLLAVAAYYARNRAFLHYDQYLAAGATPY